MGKNLYFTKNITNNDCRALDIACGVIAKQRSMHPDMVKGLLMSGTQPTAANAIRLSRTERRESEEAL